MIKTKTTETIEEFDQNGKLVKRTTTETVKEDDGGSILNNPYLHPSWDRNSIIYTGDAPTVRYDNTICQAEDRCGSDGTTISAWSCDQPNECASCGAGCKQ